MPAREATEQHRKRVTIRSLMSLDANRLPVNVPQTSVVCHSVVNKVVHHMRDGGATGASEVGLRRCSLLYWTEEDDKQISANSSVRKCACDVTATVTSRPSEFQLLQNAIDTAHPE